MKKNKKNTALDNFKIEVASDLGIDLSKTNLTAKESGAVGGEMVKRMIKFYEDSKKN